VYSLSHRPTDPGSLLYSIHLANNRTHFWSELNMPIRIVVSPRLSLLCTRYCRCLSHVSHATNTGDMKTYRQ
jgi:hypothetical protein